MFTVGGLRFRIRKIKVRIRVLKRSLVRTPMRTV